MSKDPTAAPDEIAAVPTSTGDDQPNVKVSRKEAYEQEIGPMISTILHACQRHGIGAVIAFDLDDAPTDPASPAHVVHFGILAPYTHRSLHYASMALAPPPGVSMQPMRGAPTYGIGAHKGKAS